jgi:hypothetical protein
LEGILEGFTAKSQSFFSLARQKLPRLFVFFSKDGYANYKGGVGYGRQAESDKSISGIRERGSKAWWLDRGLL